MSRNAVSTIVTALLLVVAVAAIRHFAFWRNDTKHGADASLEQSLSK